MDEVGDAESAVEAEVDVVVLVFVDDELAVLVELPDPRLVIAGTAVAELAGQSST